MRQTVIAFIMSALALIAAAPCFAQSEFPQCDVRDMALIYQGGTIRVDWTPDQIAPYVTHKFADGREEWLFDGFLFLEFKDGKGYTYSPGYDKKNATRKQWEWYLDRLFEPGKSLSALDSVIGEKKRELGDPGFRHKVTLTCFVPMPGQKDWGEVDGRALDFDSLADKKTAAKWFLDQLTERFAKAGYDNLDLWGIYWIDEDMVNTGDFPKEISEYVHGKGLKFVWIPYFRAEGHQRWRDLGFDIVYHQPNYMFTSNIPLSRLDEAIDIAQKYGMAMEFEADELTMVDDKTSHRARWTDYVEAFRRRGVFERSPLAYYLDNLILLDIVNNPTPATRAMVDTLAGHIVARRHRAQR